MILRPAYIIPQCLVVLQSYFGNCDVLVRGRKTALMLLIIML